MIRAYQGETVKLEVEVLDTLGAAADLTGATVKFAMRCPDLTLVEKTPTVTSNVLSVELLPSETLQSGIHKYEFRISLNDEVDSLRIGLLNIESSVITAM